MAATMWLVQLLYVSSLAVVTAITVTGLGVGPHGVDFAIDELTDESRTYDGQPYRVMTTTFFPVGAYRSCKRYQAPYMTPLTAQFAGQLFGPVFHVENLTEVMESLELTLCLTPSPPPTHVIPDQRAWPWVIFSGGASAPRVFYNALAEAVASHGYIVTTVDTPGQCGIVQYLDGSSVEEDPHLTDVAAIEARNRDMVFVKRQGSSRNLSLPQGMVVDHDRVALWGHSFGGAAAAQALLVDPAFRAGVDMDGTLVDTVVEAGVSQPFLIFGRPGDNFTDASPSGTNWTTFVEACQRRHPGRRSTLELSVLGAQHYDFSDAPLILDAAGDCEPVASVLGSIRGARVNALVSAYVAAFFEFALEHRVPHLLRGPSPRQYPEVVFESAALE